MTKDGKEWKTFGVAHAMTSMRRDKLDTITDKVFIKYDLYLNNAERSDIDNRLKLTNDVLESAGILGNDNLIFGALVTKHKCSRDEQRVELSIYEYSL